MKTGKRIISMIMAALLTFVSFPKSTFAYDNTESAGITFNKEIAAEHDTVNAEASANWIDDYEYEISDDEIHLRSLKDTAVVTDVVIPATVSIDDKSYEVVLDNSYSYKSLWDAGSSNIKYISFNEGVKLAPSSSFLFYNLAALKKLDITGLDTGDVTDMRCMFANCCSLESLDLSNFDTSNVTDMQFMFEECSGLKNLNVSSFDTSKVLSMGCMFRGCSSLSTLNLDSFNTSNVNDMACMFESCSGLKVLDLSGFDTGKVTDMSYMFSKCSNLSSLDISGFNTSNVTGMVCMFGDCSKLSELDVTSFNTYNTTNMSNMFMACSELTSLDLSSFDTTNVTGMHMMFGNCSKLKSLDISSFNTKKVTSMGTMFYDCASLTSLDVSRFDTANVTNMTGMFERCLSLERLDVSSFDTANVTNICSMFSQCAKITSLDLSNFSFEKALSEDGEAVSIFYGSGIEELRLPVNTLNNYSFDEMEKLKTIYYAGNATQWKALNNTVPQGVKVIKALKPEASANWIEDYNYKISGNEVHLNSLKDNTDIIEVVIPATVSIEGTVYDVILDNAGNGKSLWSSGSTDIEYIRLEDGVKLASDSSYLFSSLYALTSLDISGLNTSNVTNMSWMFFNCSKLEKIDVSGFDTSHATNMGRMFYNCTALEKLDVSGFNTSSVTDMEEMFSGCHNLNTLSISGFDTTNVMSMSGMFEECSSLTKLDLSNFNFANATCASMFSDSAISELYLPVETLSGYDFSEMNDLSKLYYAGDPKQWVVLNNTVPEHTAIIYNYKAEAILPTITPVVTPTPVPGDVSGDDLPTTTPATTPETTSVPTPDPSAGSTPETTPVSEVTPTPIPTSEVTPTPASTEVVEIAALVKNKTTSVSGNINLITNGADQSGTALYTMSADGKKVVLNKKLTKKGNTFKGWYYTDPNGREKKLTAVTAKILEKNPDLKLNAKFIQNKYKVKYIKSGKVEGVSVKSKGSVKSVKVTYSENMSIKLSGEEIEPKDPTIELRGWTTNKADTAKIMYDVNEEVFLDELIPVKGKTIKLYAVWGRK